jgi:hypothetical protein
LAFDHLLSEDETAWKGRKLAPEDRDEDIWLTSDRKNSERTIAFYQTVSVVDTGGATEKRRSPAATYRLGAEPDDPSLERIAWSGKANGAAPEAATEFEAKHILKRLRECDKAVEEQRTDRGPSQ